MATYSSSRFHPQSEIKPLGFGKAIILFGVPALGLRWSMYSGMAWLTEAGVVAFDAFIVAFVVPLALLFCAALIAAQQEQKPLNWSFLKQRFRFQPLSRRGWLLTGACFLLGFLGSGLFGLSAGWLAQLPGFAPPAVFPEVIDPRAAPSLAYSTFMGQELAGNWRVVGLYLVLLFFNIMGEELWWRGYILPRQEQVYGARTWLIHGLMWWGFHLVFYPWQLLGLLPLCLALSYAVVRTRSIWPGIVIHSLSNGLAMLPILAGVVG